MTVTISQRAEALLQTASANRPGQSPEDVLEIALADLVETDNSHSKMTPEQAVNDIRELRKGLSLGGLRIRDLIDEGRKY